MAVKIEDTFLDIYYQIYGFTAGLKKGSLSTETDKYTKFSYYEKGSRIPGQPSIVLLHGFYSTKASWLSFTRHMSGYHCLVIDIPGHGETLGLLGDEHNIHAVTDELKIFIDKMNLTKPICLIGHSIGAVFAFMFTVKNPQYVSLLCLLAPIPTRELETSDAQQLREEVNRIPLTESFFRKYFTTQIPANDTIRRVALAFVDYEYDRLGEYYERLTEIQCPTLILWGRDDKLCSVDASDYFAKRISESDVVVLDNCGHMIANNQPKEAAKAISNFVDLHSYYEIGVSE